MTRAASKYPPLTAEQQRLVAQFGGLVIKAAKRWYPVGAIPEDAIAEGQVGLCYAAQRFDTDRGVLFTTYARWWVDAFLLEHLIREKGGQVAFGTTRNQRHVFYQLGKLRRRFGDDDEAIAGALGMDVEELHAINVRINSASQDQSFDQALADDGDFTLANILHGDANPERDAIRGSDSANVLRLLRRLPLRERRILVRRFFHEENLQAIGDDMGLCRERVRQLEVQALNRLRLLAEGKAIGVGGDNRKKRACPFGHAYTKANTYAWGGRRICRACRAARRRA